MSPDMSTQAVDHMIQSLFDSPVHFGFRQGRRSGVAEGVSREDVERARLHSLRHVLDEATNLSGRAVEHLAKEILQWGNRIKRADTPWFPDGTWL